MKADILEQLIEDWFVSKPGWFVKHNIKFRPSKKHKNYNSKKDCVHSDIDILAFSGVENGKHRVAVVSCKSWQVGFSLREWLRVMESKPTYNKRDSDFRPREKWKYFRELISEKWIQAFLDTIKKETSQKNLTFYIAVTKLVGTTKEREAFEHSLIIKQRFKKFNSVIDIKFITLQQILEDFLKRIAKKDTPVLEGTDVGRLLQLINAAGLTIEEKDNKRI